MPGRTVGEGPVKGAVVSQTTEVRGHCTTEVRHSGQGLALEDIDARSRCARPLPLPSSPFLSPCLPPPVTRQQQQEEGDEMAAGGLEALPDSLSSLTALRHLDLSHNRLSSPPLHLTSALPHLKSLVLSGNPCAPSTAPHDHPLQH
ncbi:unnamed protein product [Closterium sp. Naga37s-1]|nr:unnamed protein product [Closterium sp. Naga37s-1]